MTSKGTVDFGEKRIKISREEIWRLKLILDDLGIMHIIDDVTYRGAYNRVEGVQEAQKIKRNRCDIRENGKLGPHNALGQCRPSDFRELIIPHFSLIDVRSLTQLDCDEAEFIGNLLYGTEY